MIRTFKHKGLMQLFENGRSRLVNQQQKEKCINRLDALDAAQRPDDMNIPGFGFHGLKGKPKRSGVTITGNWRITFGFDGVDVINVDLENYH